MRLEMFPIMDCIALVLQAPKCPLWRAIFGNFIM